MKPRNEEQKLVAAQGQTKAKQPRFKIEKLEERIAPACHYNPNGKAVGCHRCHYNPRTGGYDC
jgi:hypothetical protein